jgi:hypothetical protein
MFRLAMSHLQAISSLLYLVQFTQQDGILKANVCVCVCVYCVCVCVCV